MVCQEKIYIIHPQVYLEECKYRIKKTQIPKFIKNELKSDSDLDSNFDSDLDLDLDDKKLMAKFKKSDIDFDMIQILILKKINFSSNINEVTMSVLNFFFF